MKNAHILGYATGVALPFLPEISGKSSVPVLKVKVNNHSVRSNIVSVDSKQRKANDANDANLPSLEFHSFRIWKGEQAEVLSEEGEAEHLGARRFASFPSLAVWRVMACS